jgi:hypothetical protein
MGQLVLAAKVTHIPRMVLSEGPGPCTVAATTPSRACGRSASA